MARKQCGKCPWRKDVNPHDIPNGYCVIKHANLRRTIAKPGEVNFPDTLRQMACHEFPEGKERVCVGWLANQMGRGNNIALRLAAFEGRVEVDVETVGEQHECFEDTLPK